MSFLGFQTVYGDDGDRRTPYMTRAWIGRLRLHIFHRPDNDPDCHDHPWDFWTFPLTPYVEEVVEVTEYRPVGVNVERRLQVVDAWKITRRPAEHCHRVIGRFDAKQTALERRAGNIAPDEALYREGTIVTIVWRSGKKRSWGFLKNRDGQWCWMGRRDYLDRGGKDAPCGGDPGVSL